MLSSPAFRSCIYVPVHSRCKLAFFFFFSSRRLHTRWPRDWSSDVCSSDLPDLGDPPLPGTPAPVARPPQPAVLTGLPHVAELRRGAPRGPGLLGARRRPRLRCPRPASGCLRGRDPARRAAQGVCMSRLRRALAALTLAVLAGCSTGGETATDTTGAGYQAGDGSWTTWETDERTGPVELVGTTYGAEEVDLAEWRGGVGVLNFWCAACPPCRAEAGDRGSVAEGRGGGAAGGRGSGKDR